MDDIELAQEHEQRTRELSLEEQKNHPKYEAISVDCTDCVGEHAKGKDCGYYRDCLQDIERQRKANERNGIKQR